MTQSAIITYVLPTTRSNGKPQDPAGLNYVAISLSADLGVNFTPLPSIVVGNPDGPTRTIPDLVDGDYVVRLIVVDNELKTGAPIDTPFVIDTSLPGTVTNVVVDLQ